ncbi:putative cytochrome p450 monooxygenase [Diplodia seriata]|uniref:Putative cytochrome p450 monooxygenase n=1 Tax=Diplodia seriata TaxID=420778 RepID=A0A0G2G976_9PEZI|nr:putative cytochrome p450 monooxygenase [Diplodia seriata]
MILARHIVPWLKYVPFGNGNFSKFAHVGWEWELKYQAHRDFGDAILMVSPGKNWIYVCNAETIHDVIQRERRHDFERPVELLAVLDVFGANISTVYGADWQRQRKVTATAFTEKTNRLVWDEALQQARQMLAFWESSAEDYEEVRKAVEEKRPTEENLMTNLVRASIGATNSDVHDSVSQRKTGMTREEVFGNMFVFNFAGHDTTAHSLNFTFYLLAVHPWVQEWMNEEIKHVFQDGNVSSWNYDTFPKLNRCLAVLYETLRLYNPVLSVVKGTQDNTTDLTIDGKSYTIPPNTRVILNLNAAHSHPRACPGKKFAQVEHAAVMAALFHSHRVEPVRLAGEDMEQARKRTADCIANSGMR